MKCPKCHEELSTCPMSMCIDRADCDEKLYCWKCRKMFKKKELKKDSEK